MLRVAQISDLHIRCAQAKSAREYDARLVECILRVNAVAPDVVVATGDLADTGSADEYRHLRELLNGLSAPYYLTPGNHDDPQVLRGVYADQPYLFQTENHLSYAIDLGELLLLVLDSTRRGRAGGYVDEERLSWLDSQLQRSNTPALLALHHPPFAAGVWPMDWLGFTNVRELEKVAHAHPRIRRIASGHVHCVRTAMWGGTFACTSPSSRPQHLLVGLGWSLPKFHFELAGFLLHTWDGSGEMVTHVHRINGTVEKLL